VRKMTDKNEEKIAELEEKVSELEDALNRVNDELDHALNAAGKVEELIAYWNAHFPEDPIPGTVRKRKESDYAMTDDEWKKRTRIPHPRDWVKKSFDPTTGEFQ